MAKRATEPTVTELGKRIRRLRESAGISARGLSAKAGTTHSVVSQIEAGLIRDPAGSILTAIAAALGTTAEYLTSGRRQRATGTDGG